MDLIAWLEDLAAAYRIEPSELTARRYLKSLERWRLTAMQWEQVSDCAVLRFARQRESDNLARPSRRFRFSILRSSSSWIIKGLPI